MIEIKNKAKPYLKNYQLYLLLLPALLYVLIFIYGPIYGITIAFKDYNPRLGILGSEWVGLKYFKIFFNSYSFKIVIKNTLKLSLYHLIVGFPIPIALAILIHHIPNKRFKKAVQLTTYAPYFISIIVLVGMMNVLLSPSTGVINTLLNKLGMESIYFMGNKKYFSHLYVWSGIWQTTGWSSIIYIAALANVDPTYHEAAVVDGASKLKRIWHIDIPSIMPTAIVLLIMNCGRIMNVGFQKVFLMQNATNTSVSEIISTYVYRVGILQGQFEMATAIGLFNSIINCILLLTVNKLAKKYRETSLF